MSKRGLGRGLEALLPRVEPSVTQKEGVLEVELAKIRPNSKQPRRVFDEEKLKELAASILEHGVVQPIVVRPTGEDRYELVAGERRWKACGIAGLEKIPVIVKEIDEQKLAELSLIENIQRENLNPLEEAAAYKRLLEDFRLTQEQLSRRLGKSRPFIANAVRLLNLPEKVREMVSSGAISPGHAKIILGLDNTDEQLAVAEMVARRGLSVRQTEDLLKDNGKKSHGADPRDKRKDPILRAIEDRLRQKLGTKVGIQENRGKGKIEIEFYGYEDLQRILDVLGEEEV